MMYNADFSAKKAAALTVEHVKWRQTVQPLNQMAIDLMVGKCQLELIVFLYAW